MAVGRTAKGRLKKGYTIKSGRVDKAGTRRPKRRSNPHRRQRTTMAAPNPRRRRRRAVSNPPKRRRRIVARRRPARRRSPVRRRRTYRRNQPRQLKRVTGQLMEGVGGAFQVLSGKAAARILPELFGIPKEGLTGMAMQAAVALGVSIFGSQLFGQKAGKMLFIGALTAPVESLIVSANIPVIGPALSAYPLVPGLVAYPEEQNAGYLMPGNNNVSAYPEEADVTFGAYEYGQYGF